MIADVWLDLDVEFRSSKTEIVRPDDDQVVVVEDLRRSLDHAPSLGARRLESDELKVERRSTTSVGQTIAECGLGTKHHLHVVDTAHSPILERFHTHEFRASAV